MENYEYIGYLGSGSYGFVWKCLQRSSGRVVAVKGFKLAHTDKKFLDQAIREVRMLRAACDHPNVVQLLEAFRSSSGRVYMVFEFVERCLSTELHKRYTCGLPASQTRVVLWQLLCAAAHLHSNGIIHRDIKPGNLLMTADGVVKLCDFGFARTTRGEPYQPDRFSSYVVTRWYRSPEMLVSDLYSAASDVWSMGCTFAEIATGRPLFPGTSSLDQLWRIMRCMGALPRSQAERFAAAAAAAGLPEPPPPPPRGKSLWQRLPELDSRLLDVVQACLKLDPAQRPSAAQLLQMPYFWEIPKLISGTPLEPLYNEQGGMNFRARTASARLRIFQQLKQQHQQHQHQKPPHSSAARSGSGASAAAGIPFEGGTQTPSNDIVLHMEAGLLRNGDDGGAHGSEVPSNSRPSGGNGGGSVGHSRNPSVLLSAVAASLLGEVLAHEGGSSGSVPLLPLLTGTQPPQPLPSPSVALSGSATSAPVLPPGGGAGLLSDSGGQQVPQGVGGPLTAANGRQFAPPGSNSMTTVTEVATASTMHSNGFSASRNDVLAVRAAVTQPHPPPQTPTQPSGVARPHLGGDGIGRKASARRLMAATPVMLQCASVDTLADAACGVLFPEEGGPAGVVSNRSGDTALGAATVSSVSPHASVGEVLNELDTRNTPGRIAAAAIAACSSRGGPGRSGQEDSLTACASLLESSCRQGSGGAGRMPDFPGVGGDGFGSRRPQQAGLHFLANGDGGELSDGDGHISEDDELMEYFANKSVSTVAGDSRRALMVSNALLGTAPALSTAVIPPATRTGSGNGTIVGPRRLPGEVAHAGIQAVHHGLYGNRHGSGSGMNHGQNAVSRRVAVLAGAGPVMGNNSAANTRQAASPPQTKVQRATVGRYSAAIGTATELQSQQHYHMPAATAATATSASVEPRLPPPPTLPPASAAPPMAPSRPRTASAGNSIMGLPDSAAMLPSLQPHGTTTLGIVTPSSANSMPYAVSHGRISLPAPSCYGSGVVSQASSAKTSGFNRRRAISRQGSTVFTQLMYEALPEIGTPSGAPDVPAGTPPRRRAVMSGFTPCRTAAARAAAEGLPPAPAMAAAMGESMRSTDLSVAFSPVHMGSAHVDLMSPNRESYPPVHTYEGNPAQGGSATASSTTRHHYNPIHRNPSLQHLADKVQTPSASNAPTGLAQPYPVGSGSLHSTCGGPGTAPTNTGGDAAVATAATAAGSVNGMLLGSSTPSYYRHSRHAAEIGPASTTAAAALSSAGPVPIPAGFGGRLQSTIGLSGSASGGSAGSVTSVYQPSAAGTPAGVSRTYTHLLTAAPRSRLASGNHARESDASVVGAGPAGGSDDGPLQEFDGMIHWMAAGASPSMPGHGSGHASITTTHPPPMTLPHLQAHYSAHGYIMHPPPTQQGLRGRLGRWASGHIDSLPEDREVLGTAPCGEWRASPGHDSIQILTVNSPEWNSGNTTGPVAAVVTGVTAVASGGGGMGSGGVVYLAPAGTSTPHVLAGGGGDGGNGPRPPAEPSRLPRSGSGPDLLRIAIGVTGPSSSPQTGAMAHVPSSVRVSSARSKNSLAAMAAATAAGSSGSTGRSVCQDSVKRGATGRCSDGAAAAQSGASIYGLPTAVALVAMADGTAALGAVDTGSNAVTVSPVGGLSGSNSNHYGNRHSSHNGGKRGSSSAKWPRAKALFGGRLISSLVRKIREQVGGSGEK